MKHNIKIGDILETNCYGQVEVVGFEKGSRIVVRFLETSNIVSVLRANLVVGKVKDPMQATRLKTLEWYDCNIRVQNNAGHWLTIVKRNSRKCIVVFDNTGYSRECEYHNVVAGKVSDPYEKTFLGVGYLGEPKQVPYREQAKQLWSNMMKRCYSPKDERGYYGKTFVAANWQCFSNFLNDLPELPGFDGWVNSKKTGKKYNLDKDLTIPGNNIYSKHTCAFILESENKAAGKKCKKLVNGVWVATKP